MFNLLVKGSGWAGSRDTMPIDRVFEYTEQGLQDKFQVNGTLDLNALRTLPCLFLQETFGDGNRVVRVGRKERRVRLDILTFSFSLIFYLAYKLRVIK
jgi:hypothetical protein